MKRLFLFVLPILAVGLIGCDNISPEVANAFKGEYWMETSSTTMYKGEAIEPARTIWTPVSIYEEGGKLYVQTEMFGAPDIDSNHPKEIEGYRERPDFISPRKTKADDEEPESGIEEVTGPDTARIVIINGYILSIYQGKRAQTHPIKVKSGSETVLKLEPYKKVGVMLTDATGNALQTIQAGYEYGPMLKEGDIITWQVDLPFEKMPSTDQSVEFDRVVHKNKLYKRK